MRIEIGDGRSKPPIAQDSAQRKRLDERLLTPPFLFEHLDLAIRAGECIALTGSSGCGKSTLVKLLQGFYLPTRGRILFDAIDTRQNDIEQSEVGFLVLKNLQSFFT